MDWLTGASASIEGKSLSGALANRDIAIMAGAVIAAESVLPMVKAARERDRLARAGLFDRPRPPKLDFAALIARAELRERKRKGRRR